MSYHGTIGVQQVRDDVSFVHGQGWTRTKEFQGGENEIIGLLNSYIDGGWEVKASQDGPYMRFTATRGVDADPSSEYYDKFSISKENIQKSIWAHPDVVTEMETYPDRVAYKSAIEEAVDTGDEITLEGRLPPATYPVGWNVYRELCRGADSYETEYIVLTRERVVSIEYYATDVLPLPTMNAARIYSSSLALCSAFNIPADAFTGVTWPDATALTPSAADLQWGWRERRREIRWQEGSRVEVVQDWTFAEWSTNLYTVAG